MPHFDQTGLTPPSGCIGITGHATDTLSYVAGKHQYRFGGEFRRAQVDAFFHPKALGLFRFNGSQGPWYLDFQNASGFFKNINTDDYDTNVLELADFMAGFVSRSSITIGQPQRLVYVNTFNFFFQDAWQVTRKLSVSYGVRYDYFGPLHNSQRDLSTFVPGKGGLVLQGSGISSIYPADRKDFSPRIGFAYHLRSNGSTVVRAGFGIYFDEPNLNSLLADTPVNGGASQLGSNPVGLNPVSTIEIDNYLISPNSYIFPAVGPTLSQRQCLWKHCL